MKLKLILSSFALCGTLFCQAPRPPVTTLNGLSDVILATPIDGQTLRFTGTEWINSSTLQDLVVVNSTDAVNAADFSTYQLANLGGTVMDWASGQGPRFPGGVIDDSLGLSAEFNGRNLYKADGTTIIFNWATGIQFPLLTNSSTKTFLTTNATGFVGLADVPNAGIIPATTNLLIGDGGGNAVDSQNNGAILSPPSLEMRLDGAFTTAVKATNLGTNTNSSAAFVATGGSDFITLEQLGGFFTPTGIFGSGDARLYFTSGAKNLIFSGGGLFKFSNDFGTTARVTIGNGVAVGTTTDPGAGIVNVNTGYRIANAATWNNSLVSTDGASFKSGPVPGKVSKTSQTDQTATTETAHLTFTVPANSTAAGTVFRIVAWGNMDNGTTAITYTPRIRWGGTAGTQLIATPTVVSTTTSNTNRIWRLESYVNVWAVGASGTCLPMTNLSNHTASAIGIYGEDTDAANATVTIDTTASKDLVLSWTMSSATGTPHVRTNGGVIEIVKP